VLLAAVACLAVVPGHLRHWFSTFGPMHGCVHVAVFSIAFLLISQGRRGVREITALSVLLLLFGLLLEWLQTGIFHIPLEYYDVLCDATGIGLGILSKFIAAAEYVNG